jgi:AcrR family transcriptional regulator
MDTLATAAGVTRPVVYSHFDNREALIIALLERHEQRLLADDGTTSQPEGFEAIIRRATASYLTTSVAHGPAMRALVSGSNLSPQVEETRRRIWDAGVKKWAAEYRRFYDLTARDSRALALSHLSGLSAVAGMCSTDALTVAQATDLHVTCVLASLPAVAEQRFRP